MFTRPCLPVQWRLRALGSAHCAIILVLQYWWPYRAWLHNASLHGASEGRQARTKVYSLGTNKHVLDWLASLIFSTAILHHTALAKISLVLPPHSCCKLQQASGHLVYHTQNVLSILSTAHGQITVPFSVDVSATLSHDAKYQSVTLRA